MPAKQTLIPDGYVPRLIEGRLDTLPQAFGHAEITGPNWCEKTWTALRFSVHCPHKDLLARSSS